MTTPLQFDPDTHTYTLDGVVLPSVTRIIGAAGMMDKRWYTEAGRRRGQDIATVTELDDMGTLPEDRVPEHLMPYLRAWRRFRADSGYTMAAIEHRVHSALHGFAGTIDRVALHSRRRGSTIIDIKRGGQVPSYALQTAAYASCVPRAVERMCVQLKDNGTYTVHIHEDVGDEADFLAALRVYRFREAHGLLEVSV